MLDLQADQISEQGGMIEEIRMELKPLLRMPGEFAAFRREFDEWKLERRQDIDEFRSDIGELQREGRVAHKRIAYGKDPENGEPLPPQPAKLAWTDLVKVATAVSMVLGPVAVVVAALVAA